MNTTLTNQTVTDQVVIEWAPFKLREGVTEDGLIEPLDAPPDGESERRRYYRITRAGRKTAAAEADRLERLARHARAKLAVHGGTRS